MNRITRYLDSRWDPQNIDDAMETLGRREGWLELDKEIEGVPTTLLLRTLARLDYLGQQRRASSIDTFIYEV